MKGFLVDPMYADDITIACTNKVEVQQIEEIMTIKLNDYNLSVNIDKTEKYQIPRPPPPPPPTPTIKELTENKNNRIIWSELDWMVNMKPKLPENKEPDWQKCKLLGSLLHTKCDIERRKILTLDSMKAFEHIFKSKRISISLKIRTFNTYCASIFLYNSKLWTLTGTLEKEIEAFHRKLLRITINFKWPKVVSNEKLYQLISATKWSTIIKKRRLNWLGHLMRLDETTPVRKALYESVRDIKRKIGKPNLTWIKLIEKDLSSINIHLNITKSTAEEIEAKLKEITWNRNEWKN